MKKIENGAAGNDVRKGIKKGVDAVVAALDKLSIDVTTTEEIRQVMMTSLSVITYDVILGGDNIGKRR